MTIKIGKAEYKLVYGLRAIMLVEIMTGGRSMTDANGKLTPMYWMVLAYACLMAGTKDATITLDEFIDTCPPAELNRTIPWLVKNIEVANQFVDPAEEEEGAEKKK